MSNFTIDGRMKGLPDIQKNYMFEVWIPSEGFNSFTQEGLIIRAKTAVIPGRDFEQIETFFMGTKQLFPGKATFSNALQVTFDEFEDQTVTKALYEWQQKIFDYNPNSGTAGAQQVLAKKDYTKTIIVKMYRSNGASLGKQIKFYNCWPKTIDDAQLDMQSSDKIQRSVTFAYDYWLIEDAG